MPRYEPKNVEDNTQKNKQSIRNNEVNSKNIPQARRVTMVGSKSFCRVDAHHVFFCWANPAPEPYQMVQNQHKSTQKGIKNLEKRQGFLLLLYRKLLFLHYPLFCYVASLSVLYCERQLSVFFFTRKAWGRPFRPIIIRAGVFIRSPIT